MALTVINSSDCGESSHGDPRTPFSKQIWQLKIPPKIRIFSWKACVNALPTLLNLKKRGVNMDGMCPVCGLEAKSIYHALFKCGGVKEIWDLWKECPIVIGAKNMDFSYLAFKLLDVGTPRDMELLVVVAWAIWHNRNLRVFEAINQGAEQVWNHAVSMLSDYKEAVKFCMLGPSDCEVSWKKPQVEVFKINTDGAIANEGRPSSIGVVIRDSKGEAVAALCRVLPGCFLMDEIEALTVKAGILLARELDLHQVIVESDSLSIVQRILAKDFSGGLGHIVHGILGFLKEFSSWQVWHLKRDFNRVTHELAHFANCNDINQVWRGVSPPVMRNLVHLDYL